MERVIAAKKQQDSAKILGFLISSCVLIGSIIGISARPGPWYFDLSKPWFALPHWLFAPIWLMFYVALAVVAWRLWIQRQYRRMPLLGVWIGLLVCSFLWAPVLFSLERPFYAFLAELGALCLIGYLSKLIWRLNVIERRLLLYCAIWLAYIACLTFGISSGVT